MKNRKATRVQPFFIFSIGVLTLTASGCARTMRPVSLEPGADGDVGLAAYRVSEVEKAPHLITCADAQGPQPSSIAGVRWDHVTLGFIVTEAGVVDPVSIFLKTSEARARGGDASDRSIAEAQERALTCRYQPGTISGHPVRVNMERTFRILAQP
jgi:hypothetical protein